MATIQPVAPENNPLLREWGLDTKFVVGYSGNLGRAHEYHTVLDAITRLEKVAPDSLHIRWLFVGGGALYGAFACELSAGPEICCFQTLSAPRPPGAKPFRRRCPSAMRDEGAMP